MPVPSSDDNIAGRCDNSTDTYDKSDTSDTSDTPNKADKPQTPAKKKRRKWAVCKAKMKSGALKLKALVNSSSDSSDSESDSDSGRNGGSGSGADSGFGEDFTRPFPLKVSTALVTVWILEPLLTAASWLVVPYLDIFACDSKTIVRSFEGVDVVMYSSRALAESISLTPPARGRVTARTDPIMTPLNDNSI